MTSETPVSPLDTSLLISLIVVGTSGFEGHEAEFKRCAAFLGKRYAFFEILLVGTAGGKPVHDLVSRLAQVTPQIRVLHVEGVADFDRLAVHGYQESIGDIILLSSVDEIGQVDLAPLISTLRGGEELVRLRRKRGSWLERMSSFAVRSITGLQVDTRFQRTLGLNRQLLSELLARPEEIHLFRFTAHTLFALQTVIITDQPQTRSGLQLMWRRLDLVARLVSTSAPRLLRGAGAICFILSFLALLSLVYVGAVWLFSKQVVEGWTTTISMLSLWMFVQLGATSVLCLGLARVLDRHEQARMPRLVDEMTLSDLFNTTGLLNVEATSRRQSEGRPSPVGS